MKDLSYEKIITNDKLLEIINDNDYREVYKQLRTLIRIEYPNVKKQDLIDEIYISYLDSQRKNNKYIYENVLFDSDISLYLSNNLVESLFNRDIDYNVYLKPTFNNMNKHPEYLKDYLAVLTRDKKLMNILLDKFGDDNLEFSMTNGARTNLFIMNIIAGRLDKATNLITTGKIELISEKDYKNIMDSFGRKENNISGFNPLRDDYLFRCISELSIANDTSKEDKTSFLKKILYSRKVKLFNVGANTTMLKEILSEEDFNDYMSYLKTDAKNGNIVLYNHKFDLHMRPTLEIVSPLELDNNYIKEDNRQFIKTK